jgi:hypothetical protein
MGRQDNTIDPKLRAFLIAVRAELAICKAIEKFTEE